MTKKKLTRSRKERIIAGVLGGFGEYLNIDTTVVRIVWLVALAFTGFIPGVLLYSIAAMVLPVSKAK